MSDDADRDRFLRACGVTPAVATTITERAAAAEAPTVPLEMSEAAYIDALEASGARHLVVLHVGCGGYLSIFHTYEQTPCESDGVLIALRLGIRADTGPFERNPCRCLYHRSPPSDSPLRPRLALEEAAWDARTPERYELRTGLPFLTWPAPPAPPPPPSEPEPPRRPRRARRS